MTAKSYSSKRPNPKSLAAPTGKATGRLMACEGKFGFATFQAADKTAKRGMRSPEIYAGRHPYHCIHCGKWHVGSTEAAERKAPKAHGGRGKIKRREVVDDGDDVLDLGRESGLDFSQE